MKALSLAQNIDFKNLLNGLKNIDIRALLMGLGLLFAFYACLLTFILLQSKTTVQQLEAKLTSETVTITERQAAPTERDLRTAAYVKNDFLIDGLHVEEDEGTLPVIRKSDYLTSFRAYQTPFKYPQTLTKPVISFALMNYGLSKENSKLALDLLPEEISFILSPYANLPDEWLTLAHNEGHEIWLNVPLQNDQQSIAGVHTIFHHNPLPEKQSKLRAVLAMTRGYVGVTSITDDTLETAKDDYSQIIDEIYGRGLAFLDLGQKKSNIISSKAFAKGAPYILANTTIHRMTGSNSFESLEKLAQENGHAIAIIPPYPEAIKNLATWILKVGKVDYVIAPVSAIYDLPSGPEPSSLNNDDYQLPNEQQP